MNELLSEPNRKTRQSRGNLLALRLTLLASLIAFSVANPAQAAFALGDRLVGSFGEVTNSMTAEIDRLIEDSGIEAAATEAQTLLRGLGENAVPVIDELADPYQENAEAAIAEAMEKVRLANAIVSRISGQAAENTADFLHNSPLFAGADIGISTPTGRIRLHVDGTEVSLCRTIVGPLGTVVVTGISNAENLCHFPDERMKNPTRSLLSFVYIAAGHTHIRVNRVIIPNLAEDLTQLPAPINAETYVKTIGGQWVQIRFAGADPASIELEAKFEVGLKGNISYIVDGELEGETALRVKTRPAYAAEVVRSTGEVMLNKAISLGLDMNVANHPANTAAILRAGLQHLGDLDETLEEGLGEVGLDVKITGGIGFGAWDTAISGVSANSTMTLNMPLHALIALRAGLLEEYLDIAMGMAHSSLNLGISVIEGNIDTGLEIFSADARSASSDFVNGVLQELLTASTHIAIESKLKLVGLGDADKESIELYESGLVVPVGEISASLLANPNAFGDAFHATSLLMMAAIDPDLQIDEQTWVDLEQVVVPGILYTLKVRNSVTMTLIGFENVDLLDTIKTIAAIRDLMISVVRSSADENSNRIRNSVESTIDTAINQADDLIIQLINDARFPRSTSFGANGSLGAEAVAEIGVKLGIEGEFKGSLFLLLLGLDIYRAPEDGLLASASMPIDFSLDAGASAGEVVELTVDAGGSVSLNLFELSATHWDGELPTPALLKVAGFSVLEFDGVVHADESFTGHGFLMLPMGGIVSAQFEVDEFGNVTNGSWSGGIDLGPLGAHPWLAGTLDNQGLRGSVDIGLLGSEFSAEFILDPSGLLLGDYEGEVNIAGYRLAAASIRLEADGTFSGQYEGDIDIGGFNSSSELHFDNHGITGSGNLKIFESELVSDNLVIGRSGKVTGDFAGNIVAGGHTLSAVALRTVNGGLVGTARMDLPGVANAEVGLRIVDGRVSAFYRGDLLDGLLSQASFSIGETGVTMRSRIKLTAFPEISSGVLGLVIDASELAQIVLAQAEADLLAAQSGVAEIEAEIEAASAQIVIELEAAQQAVLDAQRDETLASNELDNVIEAINALDAAYAGQLQDAQLAVDQAREDVERAEDSVAFYNREITKLTRWYNNLSPAKKALNAAYYSSRRATLISLRTAANATLAAARLALTAAQATLDGLNSEFAERMNPLIASRNALQASYDVALATRVAAEQSLEALNADIAVDATLQPLFDSLALAKTLLRESQEQVSRLRATIEMAERAATHGAENAFRVLSADIGLDLSTVMTQSSFGIDAQVVFMGNRGRIQLDFAPGEPVASFHQAVSDLQSGIATLDATDTLAPQVRILQSTEWHSAASLIELIASDPAGGSGVASISFHASGAQTIPLTEVAGDRAFLLFDAEGQISLNVQAMDISGNVSPTTTVTISVDNSAPQIDVTEADADTSVYPLYIRASDPQGSGISYLAISARGAESFTEFLVMSNETTVYLSRQGLTELTISAVDLVGNITTLIQAVEVPDLAALATGNDPEDSNGEADGKGASSSNGTAMGLYWLLLMLALGIARTIRRPNEHAGKSWRIPAR